MKLAWITDSHLDFVRYPEEWWSETLKTECDAFVFTGDVSNNHHLTSNLLMFTSGDRPVYFVLGNHDYYGGIHRKNEKRTHEVQLSGRERFISEQRKCNPID